MFILQELAQPNFCHDIILTYEVDPILTSACFATISHLQAPEKHLRDTEIWFGLMLRVDDHIHGWKVVQICEGHGLQYEPHARTYFYSARNSKSLSHLKLMNIVICKQYKIKSLYCLLTSWLYCLLYYILSRRAIVSVFRMWAELSAVLERTQLKRCGFLTNFSMYPFVHITQSGEDCQVVMCFAWVPI